MEADRKAIASVVCGCISFLLPLAILGFTRQRLAGIPDWMYAALAISTLAAAVAAVVLGHLSLQGPRRTTSTVGLCLGYGVLTIPIWIAAQAMLGRLANTPLHANEALATGLVPVIQIALEEYRTEKGRYPDSLAELAERTAISPELLRTGRNNGYVYRYEATPDGYRLRAGPEEPGKSGRRLFDVTQKTGSR